MSENKTKHNIGRTVCFIAVLWTLLVAALAVWRCVRCERQYIELARVQARAAHTKDLIYRQWNADHGGVYVPITDTLKPNPYLDVPHRDVETLSGQKLTLINPAYMTRQVHEIGAAKSNIDAHITSRNPVNPINVPDDWERIALEAFEKGDSEYATMEQVDGQSVMRLMRPLVTKQSCLKCHQNQGYQEGDVHGGISVAVPVDSIAAAHDSENVAAGIGYGIVWVIGLAGLLLAWRALTHHIALLEQTNALLDQQKGVAEDAVRVKSMFLANMSHEIRTPLTAILGYADILDDEFRCDGNCDQCARCADHARMRGNIRTIRRNGSHLLNLVNDILDLSKIDFGELCLEPVACRPADTIQDVASLMQVRAEAKGLDLTVELNDLDSVETVVDVTRFRQILLNLVGNAVKFTESGSVRIVMESDDSHQPHRLVIRVIDTGPGISEEKRAAVFQPFIQAEMSASRKHGGTGLGLAISHRLATAFGGEIELESTPGQGSCFSLILPIVPPSPDSDTRAEKCREKDSPEKWRPVLRPSAKLEGHVLLVEDGADNQRLISHLLRLAGLEVTLADNGRIACDLVLQPSDEQLFDLILMDMQMPVMSGYQATRALRQSGYQGPIVALTAHAMGEEAKECLDAGCDEHVAKPIDRAAFSAMLAEYLPPQSATPETADSAAAQQDE